MTTPEAINISQLPPPAFAMLIPGTPSFIKKETMWLNATLEKL